MNENSLIFCKSIENSSLFLYTYGYMRNQTESIFCEDFSEIQRFRESAVRRKLR